MTLPVNEKPVREGSVAKRAAILAASRELFVGEGFERTSMDAVAARANVSKRTVYDYYGDKRTLLLAVVEDVGQSLLKSIRLAIQDHLSDESGIEDSAQLESALIDTAAQVATTTISSSDYTAFIRLVTAEGKHVPELRDHLLSDAPEEAIAERLAHFAQTGLLHAPNPRLAADHFNALAFSVIASNNGPLSGSDPAEVRQTITDGVRAFMRAYAPE